MSGLTSAATRFMGSRDGFDAVHWDHEPGLARSSRRESAQTSPMKNERTHVRCYKVHGERYILRLCAVNHSSSGTVVSYFTPFGTGTASGTVVPSLPAARRVESRETNAVNGDIIP